MQNYSCEIIIEDNKTKKNQVSSAKRTGLT